MTEVKFPDYAVYAVTHIPNREKAKWDEIGVAFCSDKGTISIKLRALPLNGDLVLIEPKPRDA